MGGKAGTRQEGERWIIAASGPSLTDQQCELAERLQREGRARIITINCTHRRFERPDIIYAADRRWWREYYEETQDSAEKVTADEFTAGYRHITHVRVIGGGGLSLKDGYVYAGKNSGYQALQLAVQRGAKHISLIGYDMQHTNGKRHWHDDYGKGWHNADGIETWAKYFNDIAKGAEMAGIDIANCTEQTALNCFRRSTLEKEYGLM